MFVKGPSAASTVGVYAIRNPASSSLMVFVYNFQVRPLFTPLLLSSLQAVGNSSISNESVQVVVSGVGSQPQPSAFRIDAENCNAPALWTSYGQPTYPTQAQIAAMQACVNLMRFVSYSSHFPCQCVAAAAVFHGAFPERQEPSHRHLRDPTVRGSRSRTKSPLMLHQSKGREGKKKNTLQST